MTRFEEAADPERYPGRFDWVIRRHIADGLTDAEIVEELGASPHLRMTAALRREGLIRIAAIRALEKHPEPRPGGRGPRPMVDRAAVETTRRDLEADREPSGERAIAKRLGVSRDAVRYALGKDRRRPRA